MKYLMTISLFLSFFLAKAQLNVMRELDSFNKIEVFGNIDVEMKLSNKETLKIRTYKVEQEKVSIKVVNNTLKISLKSKLLDEDVKVKVYITYKEIVGIRSDAGAEIRIIDRIVGDRLLAEAANGGRILMKVRIELLELKLFQGAHIDISGACLKQKSFVNTGSVLSATNLESEEINIRMNTKATAEVTAIKKIEAKVNSGSKLSFFGTPEEEVLKTTFGGSISKWDENNKSEAEKN
ncbi:MAG: hypothetical protein GQ564_16490 [Bacteroidales bacterium]|nr:hypothetical protein [Bacteroidales bacterium]